MWRSLRISAVNRGCPGSRRSGPPRHRRPPRISRHRQRRSVAGRYLPAAYSPPTLLPVRPPFRTERRIPVSVHDRQADGAVTGRGVLVAPVSTHLKGAGSPVPGAPEGGYLLIQVFRTLEDLDLRAPGYSPNIYLCPSSHAIHPLALKGCSREFISRNLRRTASRE